MFWVAIFTFITKSNILYIAQHTNNNNIINIVNDDRLNIIQNMIENNSELFIEAFQNIISNAQVSLKILIYLMVYWH